MGQRFFFSSVVALLLALPVGVARASESGLIRVATQATNAIGSLCARTVTELGQLAEHLNRVPSHMVQTTVSGTPIRMEVLLPEGTDARPPVFILPGYASQGAHYRLLGQLMREEGYPTVLVDPPDRYEFSVEARGEATRKAFEVIEAEARKRDNPLYGRIQLGHRFAIGHSYGGATLAQNLPVDAQVILTPGANLTEHAALFKSARAVTAPTLIIAGDRDPIRFMGQSGVAQQIYEGCVEGACPSARLVRWSAGHMPFTDFAPPLLVHDGVLPRLKFPHEVRQSTVRAAAEWFEQEGKPLTADDPR